MFFVMRFVWERRQSEYPIANKNRQQEKDMDQAIKCERMSPWLLTNIESISLVYRINWNKQKKPRHRKKANEHFQMRSDHLDDTFRSRS